MRLKGTATLVALIAAGTLSTAAGAAVILDWSGPESMAFATATTGIYNVPANGATLTIVGKIDVNFPCRSDIADPNKEYTFVFDQLTAGATIDIGPAQRTSYTGGRFRLFEDASPDRDYGTNPPNATSPSTFEDGTLLILGTLANFQTTTNEANNGGNYAGKLTVTGGTLAAQWWPPAPPNTAHDVQGVWNRTPGSFNLGYIRSCDGKIDLYFDCPVPVAPSTWGKIKNLYN